jgi:hypothetical protein
LFKKALQVPLSTGDALPFPSNHPTAEHTPPSHNGSNTNVDELEHHLARSLNHRVIVAKTVCHATPKQCEGWESCSHSGCADCTDSHKKVIRLIGKPKHGIERDWFNLFLQFSLLFFFILDKILGSLQNLVFDTLHKVIKYNLI